MAPIRLWPATARIRITHWWRHGRLPDLASPQSFNELVQHRKLHDRDPRLPALADKQAVKAFVAAQLGPSWLTPTLWSGRRLPVDPPWPLPFVVKSRHGCRHIAFVRSADDWPAAHRRAHRWLRRSYGWWLDEWLYAQLPRGIIVEPFIGPGPVLPLDYKVFVFGGRAEFVQVHLDREGRHRWLVFDRDWQRQSAPTADRDPPRPVALEAMLRAAETLGRGFVFVRVDLYEVDGVPRFGEMTFYPGSGLERFDPVALDEQMGMKWRAAVAAASQPMGRDGQSTVTALGIAA